MVLLSVGVKLTSPAFKKVKKPKKIKGAAFKKMQVPNFKV